MLGGEEEKDPDAQKKEEERQEALRQQEEERKAKHARMEAEREKVRQQIRDKVSILLRVPALILDLVPSAPQCHQENECLWNMPSRMAHRTMYAYRKWHIELCTHTGNGI